MEVKPSFLNSSRQFPSCEDAEQDSPNKLSDDEENSENFTKFKQELELFKQIVKRWGEKNINHIMKVTHNTKDENDRYNVNLEMSNQQFSLIIRINNFHLFFMPQDDDNDDQNQITPNIVEIANVDYINNYEIDQFETQLSNKWMEQYQQIDKNNEKVILSFLDELKARFHKIMNSNQNQQKPNIKDFVPYPGGATISWNSQGHLAVIKNLKIRQLIAQDPSLKMLDQTQKKMSRLNQYLSKERQNTKNQASLRLNKDFLLADSEENDENVFIHNFTAFEEDENIDNKDYLNFKFDNFHFFPDVMQICTFFVDHKKNLAMTSQTSQDPKKEENNLMNRRREKIVLNPNDIYAEKLKKLLINSQSKRRDNNDDGLSSIFIFDFEKRQLMEENKLLDFLNKMIDFGKKNIDNDAKYVQFIIQQILYDSTDETINIVKNIQKVLESKDYDDIENISYIGNFLLKNYFNELIETNKEKFLILAFQALIFENFISFVRIKNFIRNVANQFKSDYEEEYQMMINTCNNLKFDRFSFTPFCIQLSHFPFVQKQNIFKQDTTKSQEFVITNQKSYYQKANNKFTHAQIPNINTVKVYQTVYQLINQNYNFERIEPYNILQQEHRAKFLAQYIQISKNLNRRMLFIKERFLEKQIKLNFSIRRLIIFLNCLLKSFCEGVHTYINDFKESCQNYELERDNQQEQECSVCEFKVKLLKNCKYLSTFQRQKEAAQHADNASMGVIKSILESGLKKINIVLNASLATALKIEYMNIENFLDYYQFNYIFGMKEKMLCRIYSLYSSRGLFNNQVNENLNNSKRKEDVSISKFKMQSTFKQKDQLYDKDDNYVHSIYDQSSDQSSRNYNFEKKKKRMFLNVLSDYFEKDKSLQKINMIQKQLENIQTVIPFKAKYFTRDAASQIIKENSQLNKPTLVLKNTSLKSIQQEKVGLGFVHDYHHFSSSIFDIFQAVIIPTSFFFWIIDLFIELNTGVLERGELIVDKVYIASKYFKQRLILDLIGILPIAYFIISPSYKQISIDFLIILKLKHFYQTFSRLEHYLSYQQDKKNLIDLLKLVLLILVTNHLIALLWYRLATFEKNFLGYKQTWIDNLKINANSFMDYYQIAIYFATVTVYTVGYGDISPCTLLECSFVTLTIIITGIIFAYAINQIGLIIFMQQKNVNQDLRMRIRNYLEHMHRQFQENNSDGQKKVFSKISPSLLKEINQDIYKEFIFSNEVFNSIFSLEFLKSTLDAVEEFVATPGEYLFKEGERDDQSIYFVFEGKVQITLNQQIVQIIKGQAINNKYQLQLKNKNENSQDKFKQSKLQDQDYKLINEFLKKQNFQMKTQKSIQMTNLLLESNKKTAFQQEDDFFDLNRLADEQSGKTISKRQNVKQVAMDILLKLKEQNKYFGEYNFFSKESERIYSAQAKEFSRIYKMKRETFLEKIKDFQSDFEKFCEIQDEILQFKHSLNFKLPCVVCGSLAHQHTQCQFIHYAPNQWNLIQLHNFSLEQERRFQSRWGLKSFKPTLNQKYIEQRAEKIQKTHKEELDQILQNLDKSLILENHSYNNLESQISIFNQQESSKQQENEKIDENVSDEVSEYQSDQYDGLRQRDNTIRQRNETIFEFQDSKLSSNIHENKNIFKKTSQQRLSSKTTSTRNQKSIQENQFTSQFTQQQQQQDEQQVIQYLNEKILLKDQQQQQFSNNEQTIARRSFSNQNKSNIQSNADLSNKVYSMASFNLKLNTSNNLQCHQPNISNFVASSINSKREIISPNYYKNSDTSKQNSSQKEIPVSEDYKKEIKSNFDNMQSIQKISTSHSNLQDHQISSRSIKDYPSSRQRSRYSQNIFVNKFNIIKNPLLMIEKIIHLQCFTVYRILTLQGI
ncbi:cation channel family protein (macronuclear) [Tetrahymena thermophila SB210]|uniref:Cation channel family protein n=1 Tax=Tetrahymena thermophila (strain SB210) TaxID=312017 RepID=Q24IL3_TETTS|nr:cation channel family protein [Tetrahymena thermophila SB210]EAS07612.2 cation channel family protein [Tetrahymena thermophila SB210]|eukprot:XP_001027854.2 cation channel family protein [Tetrahymena thermophila SB210]